MSDPIIPHSGQFVQVPVEVLAGEVERQGRTSRLSFGARIMWATLKLHAWGEKRSCFPSIKRLAKFLGTTPRWITHLLTELEHAGYVIRETRPGKVTIYHFTDPSGPTNDHSGVHSNPRTIIPDSPERSFTTPPNNRSPESYLIKQIHRNRRTPSATPPARIRDKHVRHDPDVQKYLDFYHDTYLRRFGQKPDIQGKRDYPIMRQLTKLYGPLMPQIIDRFIDDHQDSLLKKTGHTIRMLRHKAAAYAEAIKRPPYNEPTCVAHRPWKENLKHQLDPPENGGRD